MRIARVFDGSSPTVALAFGSGLYRASAIEAIQLSPLKLVVPPAISPAAFS